MVKKDTPLHLAVQKDDSEEVEILLDKNAPIEAKNKIGRTPLHVAVEVGTEQTVLLLLERGAHVDSMDDLERTPLLTAVTRKSLPIVQHILQFKPDISNKSNQCAFRVAVGGDDGEVNVRISNTLAQYGFTLYPEDKNDPDLLYASVVKGYAKFVDYLLKNGSDPIYAMNTGHHLVHAAVRIGHQESVKLLIDTGCDINTKDEFGMMPIDYCMHSRIENPGPLSLQNRVIFNFEHFGDFDFEDEFGQMWIENSPNARFDEKIEIFKLLLAHGAAIPTNVEFFNNAVKNGYLEVCEILVKAGVDVNKLDDEGNTALHCITRFYSSSMFSGKDKKPNEDFSKKIAELLTSNGANVNARNKYGYTALHAAALNGNIDTLPSSSGFEELIRFLIDEGADVNAQTRNNETALTLASQLGRKTLVNILLNSDADIHLQNSYGSTALHLASLKGDLEIVQALLAHRADVNATDNCKMTPFGLVDSKFSNFHGSDENLYMELYHEHTPVMLTLAHHMIKLKTAGFYVRPRDFYLIHDYQSLMDESPCGSFFDIEAGCKQELNKMKNHKLCCHITLDSTLGVKRNITYLSNEVVVQNLESVLRSTDFKDNYPMYGSLVEGFFKVDRRRYELLMSAIEWFDTLTKTCNIINPLKLPVLPTEVKLKLLAYLNDLDLKRLISCGEQLRKQIQKL